uniref:hypothetical protein n=1 Tax=Amycolatopsis sp. CA-151526 TaxID=3239921 RepID=UPI003F49AFB1
MSEAIDEDLLGIAEMLLVDRGAAGRALETWFGRVPNPRGRQRLQAAPIAVPRLLAEALQRGGVADGGSAGEYWAPSFTEPGIREPVRVVLRATARHLNGEPDVADALVQAHLATHGLSGGWEITVNGLELLATELAEQRAAGAED